MSSDTTMTMTAPRLAAFASLKDLFEAPKKLTIIRLRWLVVIICSYLLLFSHSPLLDPLIIHGFVLFYLLSNALLYFIDERNFQSSNLFSPLVIFDTVCLTFSLVVTGQLGTDLYLTYFLIIVISSFWQDFRWTMGFAVLITLVYAYLLFMADSLDSSLFLRLPFLFISSVFYGYFTQLVRSEKTLMAKVEEAGKDFLTGLPNRRAFEEKIKEEFERAQRYQRSLSFLMMDVDDFKKVNDTFGHQWGDEVLRKIGQYLSVKMRDSDYPARYGGEEFAMILPETDLERALEAAKRMRKIIEGLVFEPPTRRFSVTLSIGVSSTASRHYENYQQLINDGDQALYVAKHDGKNRVEVFPEQTGGSRAANLVQ